jgi:hypothetical protein
MIDFESDLLIEDGELDDSDEDDLLDFESDLLIEDGELDDSDEELLEDVDFAEGLNAPILCVGDIMLLDCGEYIPPCPIAVTKACDGAKGLCNIPTFDFPITFVGSGCDLPAYFSPISFE